MSSQVTVKFRMDEELKKSMESVCNEMGLNIATAFTIFAKKVCREKRIPFEVSTDSFYDEKNMTRIMRAIDSLNSDKNVEKNVEKNSEHDDAEDEKENDAE